MHGPCWANLYEGQRRIRVGIVVIVISQQTTEQSNRLRIYVYMNTNKCRSTFWPKLFSIINYVISQLELRSVVLKNIKIFEILAYRQTNIWKYSWRLEGGKETMLKCRRLLYSERDIHYGTQHVTFLPKCGSLCLLRINWHIDIEIFETYFIVT